ncbi:MAG: hypothetical protein ABIF04_07985 [Chloroflexota bacterium]
MTFSNTLFFGGFEGSGTKLIYVVGTVPEDIHAGIRYPTTSPEETFKHAGMGKSMMTQRTVACVVRRG